VSAYERVLEAFHNAKKYHPEHLRAADQKLEISDERGAELQKKADEAREEIARASDIGSFVISQKAQNILINYRSEIDSVLRHNTWWEQLDVEWDITNRHMKEFITEAHRDIEKR
jgi:hypothetical protein